MTIAKCMRNADWHQSVGVFSFQGQKHFFDPHSAGKTAYCLCGYNPVTGKNQGQRVCVTGLANCPTQSAVAERRRQLSIGPGFAVGDGSEKLPELFLERGAAIEKAGIYRYRDPLACSPEVRVYLVPEDLGGGVWRGICVCLQNKAAGLAVMPGRKTQQGEFVSDHYPVDDAGYGRVMTSCNQSVIRHKGSVFVTGSLNNFFSLCKVSRPRLYYEGFAKYCGKISASPWS